MADLIVENLNITVTVEAREGEAAFARLFDDYINRWHRKLLQQQAARRDSERERMLPTSPEDR